MRGILLPVLACLVGCSTPLPMLYSPPYPLEDLQQALQQLTTVALPADELSARCKWQPRDKSPQLQLGGCLDPSSMTVYHLKGLKGEGLQSVLLHEAGHLLDLQRGVPHGTTYHHGGWVCREVVLCGNPFRASSGP